MSFTVQRITQGTDTALVNAINNSLVNLVGQLNNKPTTTVDMGNNRVTGVNWPSLLSDAVPLGYLKGQKPKTTIQAAVVSGCSSFGAPGAVTFTPQIQGYAMFTVEPFTVAAAGNSFEVDFTAFSVDETDLGLYGSLTAALASSSTTTTFNPVIVSSSRFGRVFGVGDYILFNDASTIAQQTNTVTGTATITNSTSYEICQILSTGTATATKTWVISRAQLQSWPFAHTTACTFYRLIPRVFTAPARPNSIGETPDSGVPVFWEWAWPNKTIVAVGAKARGVTADGTATLTNLAPGTASGLSNSPGLRTLNGAAYVLTASGQLAGRQTADQRVTVQSWHSVRTVYGILRTAPTGSPLTVQVFYISPDRGTAGLIDTITFGTGSFRSYPSASAPASESMPYHATWTPPTLTALGSGWPPSILPVYAGAISGGNLTTTGTPNGSAITLAPDGEIDFIISQIGTTTIPGSDLTLLVQS